MQSQHPSSPVRSIVSSWKEIAGHFRVTVRTAQLWEEERGLPVHRMPGVKGRVYAYVEELGAWAANGMSQRGAEKAQAEAADWPANNSSKKGVWLGALGLVGVGYGSEFRQVYGEAVRKGRTAVYDIAADLERMKQVEVVTPWRGEGVER